VFLDEGFGFLLWEYGEEKEVGEDGEVELEEDGE